MCLEDRSRAGSSMVERSRVNGSWIRTYSIDDSRIGCDVRLSLGDQTPRIGL